MPKGKKKVGKKRRGKVQVMPAHQLGKTLRKHNPLAKSATLQPMVDSFERDIVKTGELKYKHPRKAATIDRVVAEFKERNRAGNSTTGQIQCWNSSTPR